MKNHVKKLLSVILAGAMAFSLTVGAFAEEEGEVDAPANVTEFGAGSKDSIEGSSDNQGNIPIDPIEIVLPTALPGMFNITLDPHGLINKTDAAVYKTGDDAETTFDFSEDHLYFATSQETGADGKLTKHFSGTSQSLTVKNLSHLPVNVDLSLDVDRGDSPFNFVATKEALAEAEGAAMYLALVSGDTTKAVADPESVAPVATVNDPSGYLNAEADAPVLAFTIDEADAPAEDAEDSEIEAYTQLKNLTDTLKAALPDLKVSVSYVAADGDDPAAIVATVEGIASDSGIKATASPADDGVIAIAITNDDADVDVGAIGINVVEPADTMSADGEAAEITFKIPVANAEIKTAISMKEDAYIYANIASLEDPSVVTVPVTTKGYYWKQVEEDEDKYPAISFNLVGDINSDPEVEEGKEFEPMTAWDNISVVDGENESTINFVLTWDVKAYDKTEKRDYGDGAENGPKQLQGQPPEITKTTKSTTTSKTITITWKAGTEDYAVYEPDAKMTTSNGKELTMTIAKTATGGTLKDTSGYGNVGANGATGTVVFKAAGLPDIELETGVLR